MKVYEKMILTCIEKYKVLDFNYLCDELHLPILCLMGIVDQLFIDKYISFVGDDCIVTEKGKKEIYDSWNVLTKGKDSVSEGFQWDGLYVPKKFLEKI